MALLFCHKFKLHFVIPHYMPILLIHFTHRLYNLTCNNKLVYENKTKH